jgi:predicted RNA-binding Zn-ribbon protein involved in translation (DUF1610 family)
MVVDMIGLKIEWEDCTIGFYCPKCGSLLVADSQSGNQECKCGVKYHLSTDLWVEELINK